MRNGGTRNKQKKLGKRCWKKLSSRIPAASLEQARREKNTLQRLLKKSASVDKKLAQIIAELRQVAAPAGQPFVFTPDLDSNKMLLDAIFRDCEDIKQRTFSIYGREALLIYLDGMTDTELINENILKPFASFSKLSGDTLVFTSLETLINEKLSVADVMIVTKVSQAIEGVMAGKVLLFVDGTAEPLVLGLVRYVKRSVEKGAEDVLRGPHDTFNETLADNIVLIRRRTKDPDVKVKNVQVGERSKTSIAIVYVANLVKPGLVEEVEKRLGNIKTDKVLASYNIEEQIVDNKWTPFPQLQMTERPDKAVAAIYEGRVALIVDNTPATILLPCTYDLIMQTPEDYTMPPLVASLLRLTRYVAALIAIYLPGIYVAVVSFHPGLMPVNMAISVAELRARTPFPSFLEALAMEIILELFQEAIARLPQKIAGAASVVGGFVIGNTIVQAGLINPLLVVVIATTAIASYTMPSWSMSLALRTFRVPVLILASILGLYGVMLGFLIITIHLCALRNFGESYLGGMFDVTLLADWADHLVRLPKSVNKTRPKQFGAQERGRQGERGG